MPFSCRVRFGMPTVMATIIPLTAMFVSPAPTAHAFDVSVHDRIVRDALPPDGVDTIAMNQILLALPGGATASDAFPLDDFRHFDDAAAPADVCVRAQDAWNFFAPLLLSGAQPAGPAFRNLADGRAARSAFGGLAHALADFYSHSNWVDLNIAAGQPERPGPTLFPTCDPATLPPGLHTGPTGCIGHPPPGFEECHATLNRDGPNTFGVVLRFPERT